MKELLRGTNAYKSVAADRRKGLAPHATLVVFPDEKYLRPLLKECAKAFFGAEEGSREARLIEEEHYSDCLFLPEAGGKLTAELAAKVVSESVMRPVEGDKKLFVLDAFDAAAPLVQNKLLKSLEEPPAGVYFLLGAVNGNAVLATVLSRVNRIEVPPFSEEEVAAALARMHGANAEAAAACGGILSAAEDLAVGGGEIFARAERFLTGDGAEAICRSLADKKDAKRFFAAVRLVLRDALFLSGGNARFAARRSGGVSAVARLYPQGALSAGLALTERAERELTFNANPPQCAFALYVGLKKEREKWQTLS